ncbi:MAG: transporter substrate-binding domain-containing protein [Campylobacterales bacterium]|nr:transporter substrate-binding domain-containing protein [Campylobacterales bacterium]
MKKITLFTLLSISLFSNSQINKTIKVCTIKNLEPFMFLENGIPTGATIDYMDTIAKHMNRKFEYVFTESSMEHIHKNIKGECDLLPIVANPNTFNFASESIPYTSDHLVLVTKIEKPYINSLNEIKNKKIGVYKDYKNLINFLKIKYPHLQYELLEENYLEDVNNGKVYGFIDSSYKLAYLIRKDYSHDLKIMKTIFENPIEVSVGVNKRSLHLVKPLNNAIEKLTVEEKNNIDTKWKRIIVEKEFDYVLMFQIFGVLSLFLLFHFYKSILLKKMNTQLKNEVEKQVEEIRKKDIVLIEKSKMAEMGQLISTISHQLKQPLNTMSMVSIAMKFDKEDKTEPDIEQYTEKLNKQIDFMSETIDLFRHFFNPNKEKEQKDLLFPIEKTLEILHGFLIDVTVVKKFSTLTTKVDLYPNEVIQVCINILKNAKEFQEENKISNKVIKIEVYEDEKTQTITIHDNGGGINENIIGKVFQQYFSTKGENKGTGIGLNISKEIVEKRHNGKIYVQNESFTFNNKEYFGAKFYLKITIV